MVVGLEVPMPLIRDMDGFVQEVSILLYESNGRELLTLCDYCSPFTRSDLFGFATES